MPDNFLKTAERMHESSEQLHRCGHFHNASYMAGYVGECYLKLLAGLLNLPGIRGYSHDISGLNSALRYAITSGTNLNHYRPYLIDMANNCPKISAWSPGKRYDDASGWDSLSISSCFQTEKEICFQQIVAMYMAGQIS